MDTEWFYWFDTFAPSYLLFHFHMKYMHRCSHFFLRLIQRQGFITNDFHSLLMLLVLEQTKSISSRDQPNLPIQLLCKIDFTKKRVGVLQQTLKFSLHIQKRYLNRIFQIIEAFSSMYDFFSSGLAFWRRQARHFVAGRCCCLRRLTFCCRSMLLLVAGQSMQGQPCPPAGKHAGPAVDTSNEATRLRGFPVWGRACNWQCLMPQPPWADVWIIGGQHPVSCCSVVFMVPRG